jgi:hypothetical protein
MSRLEKVIDSVRARSGMVEKSEPANRPRLSKAISTARERLSDRYQGDDLEKGVHDAMYHHALHARAANSARYKGEKSTPEHDKKCSEIGKQHEFMFLRHALENAKHKAKYAGDMKWKMQKSMDYYDSEAPYDDSDPDYKKACDHYKNGGGYVGHKHDKFKED